MKRASVSIASNIAEGASRKSEVNFAKFLEMAIGSAFVVENQLIIACKLAYMKSSKLEKQVHNLHVLQKQINQLISVLRK